MATNGKIAPVNMNGAAAAIKQIKQPRPGWREYITSSGYPITYRLMPGDFMDGLRARVRAEHEESKPAVPTTPVETAEGLIDMPVDVDGEIHDEVLAQRVGEYKAALAAWESAVSAAVSKEMMEAVLPRTIRFEVDRAAVAEMRELYSLAGKDLSDESDEYVMLWRVILTDQAETYAVSMSLQGITIEEAAEQAHTLFRRFVAAATTRDILAATQQGQI